MQKLFVILFFPISIHTVFQCPQAQFTRHSIRTCDYSNILGSVCTYDCDPGYEIPGTGTSQDITCTKAGWDSTYPQCQGKKSYK